MMADLAREQPSGGRARGPSCRRGCGGAAEQGIALVAEVLLRLLELEPLEPHRQLHPVRVRARPRLEQLERLRWRCASHQRSPTPSPWQASYVKERNFVPKIQFGPGHSYRISTQILFHQNRLSPPTACRRAYAGDQRTELFTPFSLLPG